MLNLAIYRHVGDKQAANGDIAVDVRTQIHICKYVQSKKREREWLGSILTSRDKSQTNND